MNCIKCSKKTITLTKNKPLCKEHREDIYLYRDMLKHKIKIDKKYPFNLDKGVSSSTVLQIWAAGKDGEKLFFNSLKRFEMDLPKKSLLEKAKGLVGLGE